MDDEFPKIPDDLRRKFRKHLLRQLQGTSSFDYSELELFEWYIRETETIFESMLETENEALESGLLTDPDGEINDSGFLAVEYFIRRARYSHVIYLTSLLESFLERECKRLRLALPDASVPFELNEIKGDKWSARRKYVERYSKITIPADSWTGCATLIRLRNLLVHENGTVGIKVDENLRGLLATPGISVAGGQVAVQQEFVSDAFVQIRKFTSLIASHVDDVIQRAVKPKLA